MNKREQMTMNAFAGVIIGLIIVLFVVVVDGIGAQASGQRHTVVIGPNGADPEVCLIDRNDSVGFFNATDEAFTIYLPGDGVNSPPRFIWYVEPGELSRRAGWNLDNVDRWFEIDGKRIANIKTTDDPPFGSCLPGLPYRTVIGGVASDGESVANTKTIDDPVNGSLRDGYLPPKEWPDWTTLTIGGVASDG